MVIEWDEDLRHFLDTLISLRILGKKGCNWKLFTNKDYETKSGQYAEFYPSDKELSIVDFFHLYQETKK